MRWGRRDDTITSDDATDERVARPTGTNGGAHADPTRVDEGEPAEIVERERAAWGGVKVGSAFFGWLTATGMTVLLTAFVAAGGAAVALARGNDAQAPDTIGAAEAIVLLVVVLVAYYCGGYVAGRMARFDGIKQGLAVWVWAIVMAAVVAIAAAVLGSEYDVMSELNSFPRIPANEGDVTRDGIIAAVALAVVALVGSMLGGLAGMRFHRRVDKAGLG